LADLNKSINKDENQEIGYNNINDQFFDLKKFNSDGSGNDKRNKSVVASSGFQLNDLNGKNDNNIIALNDIANSMMTNKTNIKSTLADTLKNDKYNQIINKGFLSSSGKPKNKNYIDIINVNSSSDRDLKSKEMNYETKLLKEPNLFFSWN